MIAAFSTSQTAAWDNSIGTAHAVVLAARLIDMLPGIQQRCQTDAKQMMTCQSARGRLSLATDECLRLLDDLSEVWSCNVSSQSESEAAAASGSSTAAWAEQPSATGDDADHARMESALAQWADRVMSELSAWMAELDMTPPVAPNLPSNASPAIMARLHAVASPADSRAVRQDVKLVAERLASRRGRATFAPYAASVLCDLQDVLAEHLELRSQGAAHLDDPEHGRFGDQPATLQLAKVSCYYGRVRMHAHQRLCRLHVCKHE